MELIVLELENSNTEILELPQLAVLKHLGSHLINCFLFSVDNPTMNK